MHRMCQYRSIARSTCYARRLARQRDVRRFHLLVCRRRRCGRIEDRQKGVRRRPTDSDHDGDDEEDRRDDEYATK